MKQAMKYTDFFFTALCTSISNDFSCRISVHQLIKTVIRKPKLITNVMPSAAAGFFVLQSQTNRTA